MRGLVLLVGLVAAIMLVPPGSTTPMPPEVATESRASDASSVTWLVPPMGYVDHPVHAAVGVWAADALQTHQDLKITITLNHEPLFTSDSIHEHDGFHTLVVMPNEAGTLRLYADDGSHAGHQVRPPVRGDNTDSARPVGVMTEIPIHHAPGDPKYPDEPVRFDPYLNLQDNQMIQVIVGDHHDRGHSSLVDLSDAAGRLLVSAWPSTGEFHYGHFSAPPGGFGDGRVQALVTSPALAHHTLFTETISLDLDESRSAGARTSLRLPESVACADSSLPLVTDPNPVADVGTAWQQWTDIRFSLATDAAVGFRPESHVAWGASYNVFGGQPVVNAVGDDHAWGQYRAFDPFRELTLRFPDPGHYELVVGDAAEYGGTSEECRFRFQILPNTDNEPGTLQHTATVENGTVQVGLVAERDGLALPHYEFDTRVIKLHTDDTPGRLVWKGKLHGHDGHAMFKLAGLEAGDYEVRTYPSPQDLGTPPLAADSEDGFVYRFTIAATSSDASAPRAPVEVAPGPGALLAPALALLALLTRRRAA